MRWFALLALSGALASQSDQPPVLKITTHLVQMNVIVHDKHGQPVTGLTKEDFEIQDGGKPQTIRFFTMETNRVDTAAREPLPAGVYTNRMEQRTGVPTSLTAILFDGLNTPIPNQVYAREQIMKFLGQLQPNDRVAIYALGRKLRILHDFTSDTKALLRVISRHTHVGGELDASTVEEAGTGNQALDDFLNEASERTAAWFTTRRVEDTANALEAIAGHLSGRPGRKNLIWVSGGFPFGIGLDNLRGDQRLYSSDIERAARAVNQANLAIYPVDARGLMGPFDTMPATSPGVATSPIRNPGAMDNINMRAMANVNNTIATMRILAERTGGRAFVNTNDIEGAIRRAVDDSQVTYNLAYSPDHEQWDGKFREIKVKVNRPGLDVRYRKGYVASAAAADDEKERRAEVIGATTGPLEATGLGLTVKRVATNPQVNLQVQLDPREVDFQQKDGRWVANLDMLLAFRNDYGVVMKTYSEVAAFNVKPETYTALMEKGISLTVRANWFVGATKARVIVRDKSTGQIGSVDVPIN